MRIRVEPIRDPDTAEILGWIAICRGCSGYVVTDRRLVALNAALWHDCVAAASPPRPRWHWPWSA